jgi:hypothetical protein
MEQTWTRGDMAMLTSGSTHRQIDHPGDGLGNGA